MASTTTPSETVTTTSPAGAAEAFMPLTITHLIVLALAIAATIAMIWWGRKLKQRRDAGEDELEERGAIERVGEDQPAQDQPVEETPVAPAPVSAAPTPAIEPAPVAPSPIEPAPVAPPPTAPTPPPLVDAEVPGMPPAMPVPLATIDTDDLTTLKGLGPKVAGQLNALGVASIADLADLSPDRAEAIDAQLGPFTGRMARDRWIEQARLLTAGDRAGYEAKFGKLGG